MDSTIAAYQKVLEKLQFTLLEYSPDLRTIYALSTKSHTIHIINNNLIKFYARKTQLAKYSDEFSYKVAENQEQFSVYKRKGLLPRDFYQYYKQPLKIINHSSFNISSIKRKTFIMPFIFNLEEPGDIPHLVEGSIHTGKVEKGETLDQAIKRFLHKELTISQEYLRAGVAEEIDYEVDEDGKLTPRLNVIVLIEKKGL